VRFGALSTTCCTPSINRPLSFPTLSGLGRRRLGPAERLAAPGPEPGSCGQNPGLGAPDGAIREDRGSQMLFLKTGYWCWFHQSSGADCSTLLEGGADGTVLDRRLMAEPLAKSHKKSSYKNARKSTKKGNEKKLTYFFIKKYNQPLYLRCVSLFCGVIVEFCKRLS